MSRNARKKSEIGIYHVMLRGIDKMNIFLCDSDYYIFLNHIKMAKERSNFLLLAYCLMTNHVHLLIKEGNEDLGDIIRRIAVGYAQYFNNKNGRIGHLFQNRFRSEPVNDERYLLVLLRYIHQNPVKAGIVKSIHEYKWSSYSYYLSDEKTIVDTEIPMGYFLCNNKFKEYNDQYNNKNCDKKCLEYDMKIRYTDDELKDKINIDIIKIDLLFKMKDEERNQVIKRIKSETGASVRQLERVLGIGRNIIQRIN